MTNKPNDGCCWSFHVETVERETLLGEVLPLSAKLDIADVRKEADAKLISAAPDLHDALKGLRDVVHDYLTHEQQLAVKAYIHAADAAIAKADPNHVSKA